MRKKGKERDVDMGEKHRLFASHMSPTRNLAGNQGMSSDQESNWQPFSLQDDSEPTEYTSNGMMIF